MSLDFCLQAAAALLLAIWSVCCAVLFAVLSRVKVSSGDISVCELSLCTGRREPMSAEGKGKSRKAGPSLDEFVLSQAPLIGLSSWRSWVWDSCILDEGEQYTRQCKAERWLKVLAVLRVWGASEYVTWSKQTKPLHLVVIKYCEGRFASLCNSSLPMVGERTSPSKH